MPRSNYNVDQFGNEENWTKFPNAILDNLDQFHPIEFLILTLIIRKVVGYTNPNHEFSVSYIMKKCNIRSKNSVLKYINEILKKGILKARKRKNQSTRYYYDRHGTELWKERILNNLESNAISETKEFIELSDSKSKVVYKINQLEPKLVHEMNNTGASDEQPVVHEMNTLKDNTSKRKLERKEEVKEKETIPYTLQVLKELNTRYGFEYFYDTSKELYSFSILVNKHSLSNMIIFDRYEKYLRFKKCLPKMQYVRGYWFDLPNNLNSFVDKFTEFDALWKSKGSEILKIENENNPNNLNQKNSSGIKIDDDNLTDEEYRIARKRLEEKYIKEKKERDLKIKNYLILRKNRKNGNRESDRN